MARTRNSPVPFRLHFDAVAGLTLICGLCIFIFIELGGQLYVTELLLIPTALVALVTARGDRALATSFFWTLLLTGFLMLCGYILSDMVRDTVPNQYMRGWSRVAFQISDVVCFLIILSSDKRNFWWYCLGAGLGGIAYLALFEHASIGTWKVTYAAPVAILLFTLRVFYGRYLQLVLLVILALMGLIFDSRAEPAIILIIAALLWVRLRYPRRPIQAKELLKKFLVPIMLGALLFGTVYTYTSDQFASRRNLSSLGRNLSFFLGVKAIYQSPLIGYGSWNDNPAISRERDEILRQELDANTAKANSGRGFSPHSQILQGWYEGGILAETFFFALLYLVTRYLPVLALKRPVDPLSGLLLYAAILGSWHLFMSPFGGDHRPQIMLMTGALFIVASEMAASRAVARGRPNQLRRPRTNVFLSGARE